MKLTLSKLDFVKSLSFIQDIVQTKSTIPILANVLLEAKQGRLHLSGTDMDMTISDKIKIIVNKMNKGTSHSRNTAIAQAEGKYIAILDDVDERKFKCDDLSITYK